MRTQDAYASSRRRPSLHVPVRRRVHPCKVGEPRKALMGRGRPCTELRNRNQMITTRVGMSWAAAHDCRKSPAYEGGVSMVKADRPVPLVAGDSRHRSNERSRYDQLWICRDPAVVFVRPDNKATTLIFRSMHLVGSSISGKCSHYEFERCTATARSHGRSAPRRDLPYRESLSRASVAGRMSFGITGRGDRWLVKETARGQKAAGGECSLVVD